MSFSLSIIGAIGQPAFSLFGLVSWYLIFLFSTVFHEAAHAFVAYRLGDDTAFRTGQVSLDPTPHIKREPIGTVAIPLLSFLNSGGTWMIGWASAPFNGNWALQYPKRAAVMAMAGPFSNLILVVTAFVLMKVGLLMGFFTPAHSIHSSQIVVATQTGIPYILAHLVSILFYLNLILFTFNLLPFPPLDGRAIPLLLLPESLARRYFMMIHQSWLSVVGMLVAWYFFPTLFHPILRWVIQLLFH